MTVTPPAGTISGSSRADADCEFLCCHRGPPCSQRRSPMGDCLSTCLGGREETEEDRLMSREARARAAEAAAARQQSFQQSSQGRAAARQHERDQAERKAGPSRGNDNARDWLS